MTSQVAIRRPGRPHGTIKRTIPLGRLRLRLEPHIIEVMKRHADASELDLGRWLEFTIADLESGGRLLKERRERDLSLRQMQHFINATIALLRCQSVEQFLELARLVSRPHQKK
jgi:hypothetical protein